MIRIINAEAKHVDQIVKLWKELEKLHHELDRFFTLRADAEENFIKFITDLIESSNSTVLVALSDDNVVGYITGTMDEYPPVYERKDCGMIYDLYVSEAFRNQHVGTDLVRRLVSWFNTAKQQRIEVRVVSTNHIALSFWKKIGFKVYIHQLYLEKD